MSTDPENLKVLTTVTTEWEASAIASALDAEGIRARSVGGFLSGFKAETPAGVSIVVAEADLPRAKSVLEELRKNGAGVDWSQVDVESLDVELPGDGPSTA